MGTENVKINFKLFYVLMGLATIFFIFGNVFSTIRFISRIPVFYLPILFFFVFLIITIIFSQERKTKKDIQTIMILNTITGALAGTMMAVTYLIHENGPFYLPIEGTVMLFFSFLLFNWGSVYLNIRLRELFPPKTKELSSIDKWFLKKPITTLVVFFDIIFLILLLVFLYVIENTYPIQVVNQIRMIFIGILVFLIIIELPLIFAHKYYQRKHKTSLNNKLESNN